MYSYGQNNRGKAVVHTNGVTINFQYKFKYPKGWTRRDRESHIRMLESRDFIPKYDGSDISSCDKAGYRDSFDKYAGRVDAWLSKQCKE